METEMASGEDATEFWKLVIPRERILFVSAAGTEEYEVLARALEEATVVAMDAEWRPVRRAGVSPRVSIMQISCRIRERSEAWAGIDRVLLARRVKAQAEARLQEERRGVAREREEVEREREEVERERKRTQEERRKVRVERENLKRERAEMKKRARKEREEEIQKARNEAREEEMEKEKEEEVVDERPMLTRIQDGLKNLVLRRNGEISEVAGGLDVERRSGVTPKKVDTEDAEQNMDNLLDVLAQAQRELMKHEEGEQHTLHTEAHLETLSKNEEKPETNYAFAGDKNLLEENGLTSRDTDIEETKVDRNFKRNELVSRRGEGSLRNEALGDGITEVEVGISNEQTGSDDEEVSGSDQEFSDAGENEFEVDKDEGEDMDSAPELVRGSRDGVGLTEEESERSMGEEVIFVLDLLALSAADFAFPLKKMLCSPKILKLGFAFKQDQIHLAASFPDSEACGCFDKVEPYIDISKLYKQLLHANPANVKHKGRRFVLGGTYSLTGISKAVLGHPLRKDAQCSDWEQRPLTEDQLYYAASDTHCLLAIFDTLLSDALALISPTPAPASAHTDAGDKPGLMIQQRASSLRDTRGEGLKLLTGANSIRGPTSSSYIFTPKMSTALQMVEAALGPSPGSSPREPVETVEQDCSGERFSKFVKKYSERLLVNEESRSKSHARRPRGRRAREALRNPDSNIELNLEWIGPAPWDGRIGGDGTPKFLCDVMVEGLARQLRCVGVDAASPPTQKSDPRKMVEQAMKEGRILLTKDIKLLRRRLMPENLAYFVKNSGKWEQLAEVMKVFQITVSESDLLSRCVKCNGEFSPRPLTSREAKEQAPATQDVPKCVLETCEEFWQCSVCGHLFWQGFQFDRARQKFAAVCVKPNDDDSIPDEDEPIQPLDIACEFLAEPEKAFVLGGSSV